MAGLVAVSQRMVDPSTVRADLPVYVVVGDEDPLNNKLAFTDEVVDRYRKAGLVDVEYRTYPGARHEVLNETNRAEVTAELVAWIERVVG
jgi:alpha-beta hydrolase superfamily lysophospholipase